MVTKLLRVVFLAPVVAILPSIMRRSVGDGSQSRSESAAKPPLLPWYVAGFLATGLAVTCAGFLPGSGRALIEAGTKQLVQPANLLIGTSMAAIGLQVDFVTLRKHGPKLMFIAGGIWLILFSAMFVLCLVWK
jgi:uncharacterized membrane protein YadS